MADQEKATAAADCDSQFTDRAKLYLNDDSKWVRSAPKAGEG